MRLYDSLKKLDHADKAWIDPEVDTGTNKYTKSKKCHGFGIFL